MLDLDSWVELGASLRTNRLRTLLTAAGVFWGVFVLVAMLGFGEGLERAAVRSLGQYATNAVFVWGRRTTLPYRGHQPGRPVHLRNADIAALEQLEGVRHLAPRNQLGGYRDGTPVLHGDKVGAFEIMGDMPAFRHVQVVSFDAGRFVNELDIQQRRKVAVIGAEVRRALFEPDADPIGSWIQIRGVPFQVVGVFHSTSADDSGDRADQTVHIPFTTFQRAFHMGDRVRWFALVAEPEASAEALEEEARSLLADRHDVHPEDVEAIRSRNGEQEYRRLRNLFGGIRLLVWLVGGATLMSGVVGVSNILLITVRERTSEFGVRRALGATPASIVALVVQEAVVLTALAGYTGLVAGVAFVEVAGWLIGPDHPSMGQPEANLEAALGAAVVLLFAGALGGVLPARRAASIQPVEALRA